MFSKKKFRKIQKKKNIQYPLETIFKFQLFKFIQSRQIRTTPGLKLDMSEG